MNIIKNKSFINRWLCIIQSHRLNNYLLTFFFVINIRNFFEIFSSAKIFTFNSYLHFSLFYIVLALVLAIYINTVTRFSMTDSLKLTLCAFVIILFPPLIDLLISGGIGYSIGYYYPENWSLFFNNILNFWFIEINNYVTIGVKIELIIILTCFFLLILNLKGLLKAVIFTLLFYVILYTFSTVPFIISSILNVFNINQQEYELDVIRFFALLFIPLFGIVLYKIDRKYTISVLTDLRIERVLHYVFLVILGFVMASRILFAPFQFSSHAFFSFIFLIISFLSAIIFSIITNNISDIKIDLISNPNRSYIKASLQLKPYFKISFLFLTISLIYAAFISWKVLFLILVFISFYFLYSVEPIRLKRVFLLSKFVIAINCIVAIFIGYEFYTAFSTSLVEPENSNTFLIRFPIKLVLFGLIGYGFTINFIDLKDYSGDKEMKINTLPTIIGFRKSQLALFYITLITYSVMYFIINNFILWIVIFFIGFIQSITLLRKKYNELYVFIPYLINLSLIIYYFLLYHIY